MSKLRKLIDQKTRGENSSRMRQIVMNKSNTSTFKLIFPSLSICKTKLQKKYLNELCFSFNSLPM